MIAALQRAMLEPGGAKTIIMVCARENLPELARVEGIMDLWKHPLVTNKWEALIARTWHLKEPATMTTTMQGAPAALTRSFSVFALAPCAPKAQPAFVNWKATLLEEDDAHVICIDAPAEKAVTVGRALEGLAKAAGLTWQGPTKSAGSCPSARRVAYRLLISKAGCPALGVSLTLKRIRASPGFEHAVVGPTNLVNDPTARIYEFTSPLALDAARNLVDEALLISPTEALIHTTAPKETWEDRLTQLAAEDNDHAGLQVKWRREAHGGRPWAKPKVLDSVMRSLAADYRAPKNKPASGTRVENAIPMLASTDAEGLAARIVGGARKQNGRQLGNNATLPEAKRWRMGWADLAGPRLPQHDPHLHGVAQSGGGTGCGGQQSGYHGERPGDPAAGAVPRACRGYFSCQGGWQPQVNQTWPGGCCSLRCGGTPEASGWTQRLHVYIGIHLHRLSPVSQGVRRR